MFKGQKTQKETYTGGDSEALQRPTETGTHKKSTILSIVFQGTLFRNDGFETGCNVRRARGVFIFLGIAASGLKPLRLC